MNALSQQERKNALLATMRGQMPEEVGNFDLGRTMDALNRGVVAGTVGGPVDLATMLMQPFGYNVERPVGGSEWIGQKIQDMGMVSANRDPLTETIASFADPVSALGAFAKAAKSLPAVAGIFAGKNAKLADLLKLQEAEQMLARGDNAADVWRATGWGKGPDGHWRFEIPDNETILGSRFPVRDRSETKMGWPVLSEVVVHPKAFDNYPQAANIDMYEDSRLGSGMAYTPGKMASIEVGFNANTGDPIEAQSKLLHELQHAIQEREGFARGGSPEQFSPELAEHARDVLSWRRELDRAMAEKWPNLKSPSSENRGNINSDVYGQYVDIGMHDAIPSEKARTDAIRATPEILKSLENVVKEYGLDQRASVPSNMEMYKRLAGEAEARLTQSRIPLTQDERLAQYPWDAEYFQQATGVPVARLIFRDK